MLKKCNIQFAAFKYDLLAQRSWTGSMAVLMVEVEFVDSRFCYVIYIDRLSGATNKQGEKIQQAY